MRQQISSAVVLKGVLVALMMPVPESTGAERRVTSCAVVAFFDYEGKPLQLPLLMNARLVEGTRVSSEFGPRWHPIHRHKLMMHMGVDLAAPAGSSVYAAADGVIVEAGYKGELGNFILIRHSPKLATGYAHALRIAPGIRPGVHVVRGQIIGLVGSTGLSTGPHLHFEAWLAGVRIKSVCACAAPAPNTSLTATVTADAVASGQGSKQ